MTKIISLDEFIGTQIAPVKSGGPEIPIDKINRMFSQAIEKCPEKTNEIKKEWIKVKERYLDGELANLEFHIKEILSRYNVAFLSEGEDRNWKEIPGNKYNEKAKKIREWLEGKMIDINTESDVAKTHEEVLKHFEMTDKSSADKDEFLQLVNANLEE